jgi:hypothetical protein
MAAAPGVPAFREGLFVAGLLAFFGPGGTCAFLRSVVVYSRLALYILLSLEV